MTKDEFNELAYNNPRDALLALWGVVEKLGAEHVSLAGGCVAVAETVGAQGKQIDDLKDTVAVLFDKVMLAPAVA